MMIEPADHVFQVGDLVWAKMKSHPPWWPGHVYPEDSATPMLRRSKREEALLLVALFGASTSFAWFHSSDLVPFDSNYAQMSAQTNSKAFLKALEDSVAEANRRVAFQPELVCEFIRRLALEAASGEDIQFIKNKATVLAYRKAVFEGAPSDKGFLSYIYYAFCLLVV